ncbi:MAG TPA: alpha/beta hydrolase, partial [Candidatus Angelobacter sp.]|nr:alpha/beta hydrolase [Candidatus Angelobacter sp.]
ETDKPEGAYSTETLADDVAAFMRAIGISKAHIAGLSLGGAVGLWLAAKYPGNVQSLSVHCSWPKTDPFLKTVVQGWQAFAKTAQSVQEMVIAGIFPWCFTPELYAAKPDYIQSLADFVRSRPPQTVDAFLQQSNAVIAHDVTAQLGRITAPTLITCGDKDQLTYRFTEPMKNSIRNSELQIFAGCAHAPIYEKVDEFNQKTLRFLQAKLGAGAG